MSFYVENIINNLPNSNCLKDVRIRNKYNRKIGRIVGKVLGGNFSVNYDDGSFEISMSLEDMYIFPEINQNTLSVEDQESFMHLLYDVVHNDISIESLQFKIDSLNEDFDLKILLNIKMKNEKYSDSYVYPIHKVLNESRNHIYNELDSTFYSRKMKVLNILISNGANLNKDNSMDFTLMKYMKLINDTIINYIIKY